MYKGPLKKQGDNAELQVFLFDHALLMVKQKNKLEQYKVYRPVCASFYAFYSIDS